MHPPARLSPSRSRVLLALTCALTLVSAAQSAQAGPAVRLVRRLKPAAKRDAKAARLDETQYKNFKRGGMDLLRKFSPENHYFVGVGRSPVGPISFIKELSLKGNTKAKSGDVTELATSIPLSGLGSGEVAEANYPEYFRHIEHFLPKDVLEGKRKVVLVDWVIGGGSVRHFATVLKAYWKSKGVKGELIMSGFHNGTQHADFDFVGEASAYGVNVSDGGTVADFEGAHNVSNQVGGRLEDLKPNPQHSEFRVQLRNSMEQDEELDKELNNEFLKFLEPAPGAAPAKK